jgi:hypothetical protein
VKARSGLWSGCVLRRRIPRQRLPNSVLSIYQRHTKKWFYEDHFVLWYKVIEGPERFHWPRLLEEDVVSLTPEQLGWLLEGYDVWTQPHRMLKLSHVS